MKVTLYLLVGGVGKGADFSELAPVFCNIAKRYSCAALVKMADQFMPLHPVVHKRFDTMHANHRNGLLLKAGHLVIWCYYHLLVRALISLITFMARGDAFTELAQKLTLKSSPRLECRFRNVFETVLTTQFAMT